MTACGGGGDGAEVAPPPEAPPQLTVQAGGCAPVLRDSGKLVYVVLDRACTAGETAMDVRLQYGTNTAVALSLHLQQELPGIAIPGLGTR